MITLITGVPGSGKTAYTLNAMLEHSKDSNRPIFVHGIPELKIAHEPIKCSSTHCDVCHTLPDETLKADGWHEWAPDGAILFYDESQNVFRPRAASTKVPDHVAILEVHRHRGLDFYLITQHPSLIDANVRRLVSKHVHLAGTWLRRVSYEWGETSANVQSTTNAVKSTYTIPKKVFSLYRSSTLHTKLNRKIPTMAYVLVGLVILFSFFSYRFYTSRMVGETKAVTDSNLQTGTLADMVKKFDFTPVVPNRLESAPAYQAIVKVTDYPKLSACIYAKSTDKCTCYTQQATVYTVSKDECMDFVRSARFNPYHVPKTAIQPRYASYPDRPTMTNQPSTFPPVFNSSPSFVQGSIQYDEFE